MNKYRYTINVKSAEGLHNIYRAHAYCACGDTPNIGHNFRLLVLEDQGTRAEEANMADANFEAGARKEGLFILVRSMFMRMAMLLLNYVRHKHLISSLLINV